MSLCLIVPCFNEENRLHLESFREFLLENSDVYILFVNDGSSDGTLALLDSFAADLDNAKVLNLTKNGGKAEAIRQGILQTDLSLFDYVGFWDADLATPLSEVELFKEQAKGSQFDGIFGSRILRLGGHVDRKWQRHILGRLFATVASMFLKLPVYDTQCGAKIYSTKVAADLFKEKFMSKWLFDVEILFRYKHLGSFSENRLVEIPLRYWKDEDGSKLKLRDFLKAPYELLRMYLKYGS